MRNSSDFAVGLDARGCKHQHVCKQTAVRRCFLDITARGNTILQRGHLHRAHVFALTNRETCSFLYCLCGLVIHMKPLSFLFLHASKCMTRTQKMSHKSVQLKFQSTYYVIAMGRGHEMFSERRWTSGERCSQLRKGASYEPLTSQRALCGFFIIY